MSRHDSSDSAADLSAAVRAALGKVIDPELRRPITELGMVKSIDTEPDGAVHVAIYLTTAACPKKTEISDRVTRAVADVPGTGAVKVTLDVMSDEQRTELRKQLRGDAREPVIPFAQPNSLTRVYAVASGKGGVGKSTVTVNLAAAMAARGLSVGVLDADIHGHSIPRMMGTTDRPTQVESMILPPIAHDVRVISIAQFTQGNTPVVWRGPMLHRALQQFLADVYWGDLDVLLLDLPPGTGDIAISVAQLIPNAEILVVTTPQLAAAEVAERAGSIALQTRQRVVGVVENMSGLTLPDGSTLQVFGEGGGQQVAERLSRAVGAEVPLLGQIPLDPALVEAGDSGTPLVLSAPDSPVGKALRAVADSLSSRRRGLAGVSLGRLGRGAVDRPVEGPGQERIVAVQQVLGQRGPRRHPPQLLQLAERDAQIVELGPEVLAQLGGHTAEVVPRLAQGVRRPPDGARQPLRPEHHQAHHHEDQHVLPAQTAEHQLPSGSGFTVRVTWRPSRTTSIGESWPMVSCRTATTNSSASATLRLPTLTTTSFSRTPPFCAGLPAFTLATCAPEAIALLTERVLTPSVGCTILPSLIKVWATSLASLMGIAKPSPLALSDNDLPAVSMPITWEFMSINGPPELPWLIDASVCTASITVSVSEPSPDSGTGRCRALTMPCVTVLRSPSGAPAASTSSPTRTLSESPSRATDRLSTLSTFSTARSVLGSRPTRLAGTSLPSLNTTVVLNWLGLFAASEMTWLLVTM